MSNRRFTFGVEFEFSLASLAKDVKDPLPLDNRQARGLRPPYEKWNINRTRNTEDWDRKIKKTIAEKLESAGLPTLAVLDPDDANIDSSHPWSHGHWVITTDSTIRAPQVKDSHDWWGVEVNSPPYIFCRESLDAILLCCSVLTSSFRINVNPSCGLHVHVGNGNDNFDFTTIRNLMAFLWCFEPVIDKLHPQFRFNGIWCRSLRASSRFSKRVYSFETSNVDILKRIFEETRSEQLFLQMGVADFSCKDAYNTANLHTSFHSGLPKSKVTLEFRQHEGTLDGPRTVAWVQTVVGLFEFAADCDKFWMASFLMEHAELEAGGGDLYEIEDLLNDIRLVEPAEFYANFQMSREDDVDAEPTSEDSNAPV